MTKQTQATIGATLLAGGLGFICLNPAALNAVIKFSSSVKLAMQLQLFLGLPAMIIGSVMLVKAFAPKPD